MAPKNARSAPAAQSAQTAETSTPPPSEGGALVFDDNDEPSSTFVPNELPFNARIFTAHVRGNETIKPPNPERRSRSANIIQVHVFGPCPDLPVRKGAVVVVMPRTSPPSFVVITGGDVVAHAFSGHNGLLRALVLLHAYKRGGRGLHIIVSFLRSLFSKPPLYSLPVAPYLYPIKLSHSKVALKLSYKRGD